MQRAPAHAQGLPPASGRLRPEDLLEHAAWLRRLATTLVRGDADADDLVQDTFLAALRRPPSDDRPVNGWLAEVIRNAGRMRARAAGRRARREADGLVAAEPSAPSAEVLLGRLSAQRRLAELVAELPEPVRTTVLLRYFEGLSAVDIARHQGVPAGTVRWRLKTGIDRLRAELDRDSGGDRRAWCLLLMPLATERTALLGALKGMVKGMIKGIWALSRATKMALTVAAVVAAVVGGAAVSRAHRAPLAAALASTPRALGARRTLGMIAAPVATPEPQVVRDDDAVTGAFEGRVVAWSSGRGVPGADVTFSVDGETTLATTDDEGRFELTAPRIGRCALALVSAPGFLPFAPEWGTSPFELFARPGLRVRDLTVQLVPAIDYTAAVVDPDGKPVVGAEVTLLGAGQGEQALHPIQDKFVSDDRGELTFHAPDDALLEARHPAFGAARGRVDRTAQVSHRLTIKLPAKGAAEALGTERIAGRVVDVEGNPVAGALVHAWSASESREMTSSSAQGLTDASGHFALAGLDAGPYQVAASHAGYAKRMLDSVAGGTDLMLDLRRGGSLAGRVLDAEQGSALPSFTVVVARREGAVKEVTAAVRSVVDAEGRFTVPDLEPGEYRIRATAAGHAPSSQIEVVVGEPGSAPVPLDLRLSRGGKLVGRLVEATADGAPIAGARVSIEGMTEGASVAPGVVNAITDEQGRFELTGIAPGMRSISLGAYQHHMRIVSGVRIEEGITTGPLNLDLMRVQAGEEPHLELAGIGAVLRAEGDGLRIDKLIPGGGGLEVGLAAGDTLLAVEGTSVAVLGFDEAVQRIRGPEGSTVRLTVRRGDGSEVEVVTPRRRIHA